MKKNPAKFNRQQFKNATKTHKYTNTNTTDKSTNKRQHNNNTTTQQHNNINKNIIKYNNSTTIFSGFDGLGHLKTVLISCRERAKHTNIGNYSN